MFGWLFFWGMGTASCQHSKEVEGTVRPTFLFHFTHARSEDALGQILFIFFWVARETGFPSAWRWFTPRTARLAGRISTISLAPGFKQASRGLLHAVLGSARGLPRLGVGPSSERGVSPGYCRAFMLFRQFAKVCRQPTSERGVSPGYCRAFMLFRQFAKVCRQPICNRCAILRTRGQSRLL
jgi:hypothetical protein